MNVKNHLNFINQLNYLYLIKFLETKSERRLRRQGQNGSMETEIHLEMKKNDQPREAEQNT